MKDSHLSLLNKLAYLKALRIGLADLEQSQVILQSFGIDGEEEQQQFIDEIVEDLGIHYDEVMGKGNEWYKKFMDKYFIFFRKLNEDIPPKITVSDGKGLKQIIRYLRSISKAGGYEGAMQSWEYILSNWHKITPFLAEQTDLTSITRNINQIITVLKNGSHDKKVKKRIEQKAGEQFDRDLSHLL